MGCLAHVSHTRPAYHHALVRFPRLVYTPNPPPCDCCCSVRLLYGSRHHGVPHAGNAYGWRAAGTRRGRDADLFVEHCSTADNYPPYDAVMNVAGFQNHMVTTIR